MFRIGQKVVCVEGNVSGCGRVSLIKDKDYRVNNVCDCSKCGVEMVDVGLRVNDLNGVSHTLSCICGLRKQTSVFWQRSSRFRPIDEAFGENVAAAFEEQFAFETSDRRTEITA